MTPRAQSRPTSIETLKAQLLTRQEVIEIIRGSRSGLYRAMAEGRFPRPVKFGASALWRASDVQAWIDRLQPKADT